MANNRVSQNGGPSASGDWVRALTEDVLASIASTPALDALERDDLPVRAELLELLDDLRWLVAPGFDGSGSRAIDRRKAVGDRLRGVASGLADVIAQLDGRGPADAEAIVRAFLEKLPLIRCRIDEDVAAALAGDPAATSTDEILVCYPGIHALIAHRLAHELVRLEVGFIPRLLSECAHGRTGIDIHPGATIGHGLFLDHGTGVVIGETTVIGDHCKIYQGVTLGAKSFERDERGDLVRGVKRHPTLEDHVTVYAGATILGGDTVIGARSIVNGGVFLTHSVPPGHIVSAPIVETRLRRT